MGLGDGTDINGVDVDFKLGLIATGDDLGDVRIIRYPTIHNKVKFFNFIGHCSHVTRVCFSKDSKRLFSAGGSDLTIFSWKIVDL